MPWPLVNRPSLQLATLKSYLEENSNSQVNCFHPYLDLAQAIGADTYARIARSGWAGEALFAPLLFPEMRSPAKILFRQSLPKKDPAVDDFDKLLICIEEVICKWLAETNITDNHLLGFSVCFFQLLSSLYLAAKIKKQHPHLPIVFGGSSCSGQVGASLFRNFQQIDYLVDGEGEAALLHLCKHIAGQERSLPKEVLCRQTPVTRAAEQPRLVLNDLPFPDFSDYFQEMHKLFKEHHFIPVLPIEFSRGCWWNRCTFCNLNLQWPDYRHKNGDRMVSEVTHLSRTHACLHFAFADNALPPKEADHFFKTLSATPVDFDFFAEIRGSSDKQRLDRYSQGGLKTVQIGIEALSSSLLSRMEKGSTVMDNIAAMRLAESCSLRLEGNIITGFPGSTQKEIDETLLNLDFVLPFAPLQPAAFFLGYDSPIYRNFADFSITAILPHSNNQKLFPEKILHGMTTITNSYRGDRRQQGTLWKPVMKKLQAWQNFHQTRKNKTCHPLHFRDGLTFILISQEQLGGLTLHHRLRGLSRKLYLFCQTPQNLGAIFAAFPTISTTALDTFLREMCDKRLMFREGDRVLSLAVHHQGR